MKSASEEEFAGIESGTVASGSGSAINAAAPASGSSGSDSSDLSVIGSIGNRSNSQQQQAQNSSDCSSQKRPMNAFLIFCKRHRSVVKQKYPHLENRNITKILGEWWANIDAEQKQKYTELARQYKEAFMKANPNFKWYKTDIKIPPNMQPSFSPPSYSNTFTSNSLASTTNVAVNSSAMLSCPNLTSAHPCTDSELRPTTVSESLANSVITTTTITTTLNTLTPKPPKKRYLENGEFKEQQANQALVSTSANTISSINISNSNATTSASFSQSAPLLPHSVPITSSTFSSNNVQSKCSIGGPPVLDIDTMNRVIENALGGCVSSSNSSNNNSNNNNSNNNNNNNNSNNNNNGDNSTALSRSDSAFLFGSRMEADVEDSDSAESADSEHMAELSAAKLRCNEKFSEPVDSELSDTETRSPHCSPLPDSAVISRLFANNSSPASMNSGREKESTKSKIGSQPEMEEAPLNLSSTTTVKASQQSLIDNLIDKLLSNGTEATPMEMLQKGSLYTDYPYPNSGNGKSSSGNNSSAIQNRKERSCKGKRYLEMLNESKLNKRNKFACDEAKSNLISGSKWVSGEFNLEEHIAALPQLGDKHLVSAIGGKKELSSTNNSPMECDSSLSKNVDSTQPTSMATTVIVQSVSTSSNTMAMDTAKRQEVVLADASVSGEATRASTDNRCNLSSSAEIAEKIVERLNISHSQPLECDGLVALAEVALQQAHRISSPSCT